MIQVPACHHKCIWKGKVKFDQIAKLNIIERILTPAIWVNNMTIMIKPNRLKICVDLKVVNKAIKYGLRRLFLYYKMQDSFQFWIEATVFGRRSSITPLLVDMFK